MADLADMRDVGAKSGINRPAARDDIVASAK
jgi:hypothetical protein